MTKPDSLSLQKRQIHINTDQLILVTGDEILEDHSEGFERKYSQDDSQIARDLSLQIVKDCTLETFPKRI